MTDYPTAQRLWAPWRMEFIRAPKEPGCFLCRIAGAGPDRDGENHVVGRCGTALLLLNRYPYNGGHLMAAPLRHVATLAELSAEERGDLMDLVCRGSACWKRSCGRKGSTWASTRAAQRERG